MKQLIVIMYFICSYSLLAEVKLFDMAAMKDVSTLEVEVLKDWYVVPGKIKTRQKLITIKVGEFIPGKDYRVPVRFVVPVDKKAKGFHLTGGNNLKSINNDARLRGVEADLIQGGVGLVYTIVQKLESWGQGELSQQSEALFSKTLNPHYSVQYWAWPASLMRSITAAYAEEDYFEKGQVACSGGSKNGATPSVAVIHDERISAVHATVSPISESPLRLCDEKAWGNLREYNKNHPTQANKRSGKSGMHPFLGGTHGPRYNEAALAAGATWQDLKSLANELADQIFPAKHFETLKKRGVELSFHPGTHDFVAYDMAYVGKNYPQLPIYLKANTGHGKGGDKSQFRGQANKTAFLLRHFFASEIESLLESPQVITKKEGDYLMLEVQFPEGSKAETGEIFWMYNRAPDGSEAYLSEAFPRENKLVMGYNDQKRSWLAKIKITEGSQQIDFFSTHKKILNFKGRKLETYLSSPYTRVDLK